MNNENILADKLRSFMEYGSPAKRQMIKRLSIIYGESAIQKAEEKLLGDIRMQPVFPQGPFVIEQLSDPDKYIGQDYTQLQYEVDYTVYRLIMNCFHYHADPMHARGADDVKELYKKTNGIIKTTLSGGNENEKFHATRHAVIAVHDHAREIRKSIPANVEFLSDFRP